MNIPEEIINNILSFRPTHPIAKIIRNMVDNLLISENGNISVAYFYQEIQFYADRHDICLYRGHIKNVIPHDAKHPIVRVIRKDINKWNRNTYNRSNKFSHFYFKTHYKRFNLIRENFDKKYNIAYDYDF